MNPTSSQPVLSIVIVTWNGKRYALECLESLYTCPAAVPVEIIVVDNASTDGTPEAIRTRFPEVRVIENQANLGFAKANNIGVAQSRGKYICLINSDVVVFQGCLDRLLALMETNQDIGISRSQNDLSRRQRWVVSDAAANRVEHFLRGRGIALNISELKAFCRLFDKK